MTKIKSNFFFVYFLQPETWEDGRIVIVSQNRTQLNITLCANQTYKQEQAFKLPTSMKIYTFLEIKRIILCKFLYLTIDLDRTFIELIKPLCLNQNEHYKLQLQLKTYGHGDNPHDAMISIDSVHDLV